jgi:SAM-dependent methyltransferase
MSTMKPASVVSGLQHRFDLWRLLRRVDSPAFRKIRERYRDEAPRPGHSKYLDARPWLEVKLYYARELGLARSRPLDILDLGTGAGYFPLVCRYFGHRVRAFDVDDVAMYNELIQCFSIDRHAGRIRAFEPLPDLGRSFDLITAFMICFNNHRSPGLWGVEEWRFFLEDLAEHQLKEGGRLLLSFNPEDDRRPYSDELGAFFAGHGARLRGNDVDFESLVSPRRAVATVV